MTVKNIIKNDPSSDREPADDRTGKLHITELFRDTIQGEGAYIGQSATFLRLQGCTLNCSFCDTQWNDGDLYSVREVFFIFEKFGIIDALHDGQHLVITGGSPLRQQKSLIHFLKQFISRYGFKLIVQIENECTIMPDSELLSYIDIWNNSPKLSNSANIAAMRYKPQVLQFLAHLPDSWFKFVVGESTDWNEIQWDFIDTGLISKNQVILMPMAENEEELKVFRQVAVDMAIRHNVRYTPREQVALWGDADGV